MEMNFNLFPQEDGYGLSNSYFACAGLVIVIVWNKYFFRQVSGEYINCGINLKKSNPTPNVSTKMIIEMGNTLKSIPCVHVNLSDRIIFQWKGQGFTWIWSSCFTL